MRLPRVYYGTPDYVPADFRLRQAEFNPDEETDETPSGVAEMLGFDPDDLFEENLTRKRYSAILGHHGQQEAKTDPASGGVTRQRTHVGRVGDTGHEVDRQGPDTGRDRSGPSYAQSCLRVLKFNPYHEPAGSRIGGRFASKDKGGAGLLPPPPPMKDPTGHFTTEARATFPGIAQIDNARAKLNVLLNRQGIRHSDVVRSGRFPQFQPRANVSTDAEGNQILIARHSHRFNSNAIAQAQEALVRSTYAKQLGKENVVVERQGSRINVTARVTAPPVPVPASKPDEFGNHLDVLVQPSAQEVQESIARQAAAAKPTPKTVLQSTAARLATARARQAAARHELAAALQEKTKAQEAHFAEKDRLAAEERARQTPLAQAAIQAAKDRSLVGLSLDPATGATVYTPPTVEQTVANVMQPRPGTPVPNPLTPEGRMAAARAAGPEAEARQIENERTIAELQRQFNEAAATGSIDPPSARAWLTTEAQQQFPWTISQNTSTGEYQVLSGGTVVAATTIRELATVAGVKWAEGMLRESLMTPAEQDQGLDPEDMDVVELAQRRARRNLEIAQQQAPNTVIPVEEAAAITEEQTRAAQSGWTPAGQAAIDLARQELIPTTELGIRDAVLDGVGGYGEARRVASQARLRHAIDIQRETPGLTEAAIDAESIRRDVRQGYLEIVRDERGRTLIRPAATPPAQPQTPQPSEQHAAEAAAQAAIDASRIATQRLGRSPRRMRDIVQSGTGLSRQEMDVNRFSADAVAMYPQLRQLQDVQQRISGGFGYQRRNRSSITNVRDYERNDGLHINQTHQFYSRAIAAQRVDQVRQMYERLGIPVTVTLRNSMVRVSATVPRAGAPVQSVAPASPAPASTARPASAAAAALGYTPPPPPTPDPTPQDFPVATPEVPRNPPGWLARGLPPIKAPGAVPHSLAGVSETEFKRRIGISAQQFTDVLFKDFAAGELTNGTLAINLSGDSLTYSYGGRTKVKGPDGVERPASLRVSRDVNLATGRVYHAMQTVYGIAGQSRSVDVQGGGTSKRVFDGSMDLYDHLGLRKAEVSAALDNGGFTWLRYGFVPDSTWGSLRSNAASRISETSIPDPDLRAKVREMLRDTNPVTAVKVAAMKQPVPVPGQYEQLPAPYPGDTYAWEASGPHYKLDAGGNRIPKTMPVGMMLFTGLSWHGHLSLTNPTVYSYTRNYINARRRATA